jgi:eukaryotic-like serine/threonine-protein kinase
MTQVEPQQDPLMARARARVGMVLSGKWTLDSLIGVGGMAAVYAATHRNGKRVAVKMLHADFARNEEIQKRFLQEGYAANTIQHDGAVSVLDDDVAPDGSAFIVMELLEGETLENRWERLGQRLPPREVLAMIDQLLDVLASAHTKNVVHRDIKPENLFLTKSTALKVLDFGIARVFEAQGHPSRPSSTRVGMVMGTPAFMAPEQALGRWNEVDGRTDLWAVGATMFTLLSGRYVHEAPSEHEQLILSATRRAPPLETVALGVPPMVAAIVDRALAFEKSERWPDASSMQAAVHTALDALGGAELIAAPSGRHPAGTAVLASGIASHIAAATAIDTAPLGSALSAWKSERELRLAGAAKLRSSITELEQQQLEARKRALEAQAKVEEGRVERSSLEQWFKRQVGTRTLAVEEARKRVREHMVGIAKRALVDTATFGVEFDPARHRIAKLQLAAESAARDVRVHEAALEAHDARSLRHGVVLTAILVLVLVVAPIVWRAVRVVEPPIPRAHDSSHSF